MSANRALRILYVSGFVPSVSAGNAGSGIFAYYLREMSRRGHHVSYVAFGSAPPQDNASNDLNWAVEPIVVTHQRSWRQTLKRFLLRSRMPAEYALFKSLQLPSHIHRMLVAGRFDIVHAVHPWLIRCVREAIRDLPVKPSVLGHVMDIGARAAFCRTMNQAPSVRLFSALRNIRLPLFEFDDYAHVDGLLVHSDSDRHLLKAFMPNSPRTFVSPPWFDALGLVTRKEPCQRAPMILYVGNSGDQRMQASMNWFLNYVFPHVVEVLPEIQLHVVSVLPDHMHLWSHTPNIICHSRLPRQELLALYDQAVGLVFPLQSGCYSTHIKVLNAFARGCPVVMTPNANAGVGAINGREAIVRDNPTEFAEQVIRLVRDPDYAAAIASRAFDRLHTQYPSPAVVADSLEAAYFSIIGEE